MDGRREGCLDSSRWTVEERVSMVSRVGPSLFDSSRRIVEESVERGLAWSRGLVRLSSTPLDG